MTDYEKQAQDFLKETNTTLKIEFLKHAPYFDEETPRDIYQCTLSRGNRHYTFTFGQSIQYSIKYKDVHTKFIYMCNGTREDYKTKVGQEYLQKYCKPISVLKSVNNKVVSVPKRTKPTDYDILACLEKYDPEDFENFCDNFGYDTDSRKAYKVYEDVKEQYNNLCMLFSDEELERMAEIQ